MNLSHFVKSFFQFIFKSFTFTFFVVQDIFNSLTEVQGLYELFFINQKFFLLFFPLSFWLNRDLVFFISSLDERDNMKKNARVNAFIYFLFKYV